MKTNGERMARTVASVLLALCTVLGLASAITIEKVGNCRMLGDFTHTGCWIGHVKPCEASNPFRRSTWVASYYIARGFVWFIETHYSAMTPPIDRSPSPHC